MMMEEFEELSLLLGSMRGDGALMAKIDDAANRLIDCLRAGGKLLVAGNGASAGDAQHIACDFVSRFAYDRPALAALSLVTDGSALTALGNDYGYETVFSRQIEAIAKPGDFFLALSTSGSSPNILRALSTARTLGLRTCAISGQRGTTLDQLADIHLMVPSVSAPRIQEAEILLGHLLCRKVEEALFPRA
jgi:D-sedoheptulose 7-phosphate isomerase